MFVIFKSFILENSKVISSLSKYFIIKNKNITIIINITIIANFIANHNIIQERTIQIKAQIQKDILYLERFSAYSEGLELPST